MYIPAPLLWLAAAILTAVIAWQWPASSPVAPEYASQRITPPPLPAPTPALEPQPYQPITTHSDTPPWMNAPSTPEALAVPSPSPAAPAASAMSREEANALAQQLQQLSMQQNMPPIHELKASLAAMKAQSGSAVVAGVRLDALSHNLDLVVEIDALNAQLQSLLNSPNPPAPDDPAVQHIAQRLSTLAGQFDLNIMTDGATPAMPTPQLPQP